MVLETGRHKSKYCKERIVLSERLKTHNQVKKEWYLTQAGKKGTEKQERMEQALGKNRTSIRKTKYKYKVLGKKGTEKQERIEQIMERLEAV